MSSPVVIIITDAVLKLADDAAGLALGEEFSCQVNEAAINATPNLQTVPATMCAPESQVPAATSFELALTWLQDWTEPSGGLSGYAYTHDTEPKAFSLSLSGAAEPIATGDVRIVAGSFGGASGVPLQTSVVWPSADKPAITLPAAAELEAEGAELEADAVPA